jgi:glucose/arabinose dehydrogenase
MKQFFFFLLFSCSLRMAAQPVLVFTPVVSTGLSSPVDIVNAADGSNRMFVVQQGGTIRVYDASWTLLNSNFLTISTNFTSGGERGLLSLVFHPDFENNRYFFVYYTNSQGGINIDRFQTEVSNPNQADASTRTNIMTIEKLVNFSNHNGGKLNFGSDGHLYFGLGDAGSGGDPRNYAQRGDSLWGKMVRINVDNFTTPPYYTVPADNPYVNDPAVLDEIYNMGLRNPWRWSFDRLNGGMWIGDVGQNNREEINYLPANQQNGANYGWRCYEGTQPFNTSGCQPQASYTGPVFDYIRSSTTGGFSVTGGYVYRGSLYPALNGYYVCMDYVTGNGWTINSTTLASNLQTGLPTNISGFGETESGELYAVKLSGGAAIYSVTTSSVLPLQLVSFNATRQNNSDVLTWETANESGMSHFIIQHSADGAQFNDGLRVNARNQAANVYRQPVSISANTAFYRLQIHSRNGDVTYSKIVRINASAQTPSSFIHYHSGNGKIIWVQDANITAGNPAILNIVNAQGQLVFSSRIANTPSAIISLEQLGSGMYAAQLITGGEKKTQPLVLR